MINFPNKIYSYNDSVLSKFVVVLNELIITDTSVIDLYDKIQKSFEDINDYIDTLACLYALNKIELNHNMLKLI